MPTVPVRQKEAAEPGETVEERFRRLASVWRAEAACVSSSSELIGHPAFREIVGMGAPVILLLLWKNHGSGGASQAVRLPARLNTTDSRFHNWRFHV